ncbi:TPA: hypothetical protein RTG63_001656 [Campylobacter jejuni]|nr:hypothetical protein [Campylobacter jejuni]
MDNNNSIFFIKGLNAVVEKEPNLVNTYAKVVEVKDDGYNIDVELILKSEGLETFKNIPVLKHPYYNVPIRKDDLVILLTLSHLQENFLETGELENPPLFQSYFALPYVLKENFEHAEYTNFFHLRTPEGKSKITLNEDECKIDMENSSIDIKSKEFSIENKNPISLKTQEELGSILIDLINILTSSSTELIVASQGVPHKHKSIDSSSSASLNSIANRLKKVLKV